MDNETVTLEIIVESIIFQNIENGYTVIEFSCDGEYDNASGNLGNIYIGERLKISGKWVNHPQYGKQFKIESSVGTVPETAEEMLAFLSSGIIKGVKEKTAQKIVATFREKTFDIIENEPSRLAKINGISAGKAMQISQQFRKLSAERYAIIALEKFGFNSIESMKIFKRFGSKSVEIVERNPYILCNSELGIKFERIEDLETNFPAPVLPDYKIGEGIVYVVRFNLQNGHTCLPAESLIKPCTELLGCTAEDIELKTEELVKENRLVKDVVNAREFVFLPEYYNAEYNIAKNLRVIRRYAGKNNINIDELIKNAEMAGSVVYNKKQREAIKTAVEKGILILTGGPGTGKTTTLRGILRIFEEIGLDTALAAPTGRAAKRMSELTGREAMTIHRLLEVEWGEDEKQSFKRNARNPLEIQALIVDELSMVDVMLFSGLLDALPLGCRLVMVGDSDQLPPVGAGNVLHDMIESETLPVIELDEVFRQAMESLIITNAHAIVAGEMPELTRNDKDFFFISRPAPVTAAETITELCSERLPKAYNLSSVEDIQVLCPSKKGETGTANLNKLLQAKINPPSKDKKEHIFGSRIFRVGDKLMQTKNNYDIMWVNENTDGMGIFNGDIGTLEHIDDGNRILTIRFEDKVATISFENAGDIDHAYAVTVHKSQGNEFPIVVIPVTGINIYLQYRNLLYTAVTRAKKIIILVGSQSTVKQMVENNKKQKRYSALKSFILSGELN